MKSTRGEKEGRSTPAPSTGGKRNRLTGKGRGGSCSILFIVSICFYLFIYLFIHSLPPPPTPPAPPPTPPRRLVCLERRRRRWGGKGCVLMTAASSSVGGWEKETDDVPAARSFAILGPGRKPFVRPLAESDPTPATPATSIPAAP